MQSNRFPFGFDINFSFGTESVFTQSNNINGGVIPPTNDCLLLLQGGCFQLLNGTDFNLLSSPIAEEKMELFDLNMFGLLDGGNFDLL